MTRGLDKPPMRQSMLVRRGVVALMGMMLPVLLAGCPAQLTSARWSESLLPRTDEPVMATTPPTAAPRAIIQVAFQQAPKGDQNGHDKNGASGPKEKIGLPQAIQMCITQNFRVLAGVEKVRQAEADLVTASLIPNSSFFADYQLIPLQHADINNQLGPPQADVAVSIPIDWLVFGKRVAAIQAARLGIEVSNADYADLHRVQVAQAVDTFYEVLADTEYLKLAEQNLEELEEIEKLTEELAKNKKAGSIDLDRAKLAVHEALLERHDRELALENAKARLRPLIGRTAADPDYEVEGSLTVTAVVPAPTLADALALAEAHRPDLISDQHDISRARATVELERRKARPQVAIVPGWSYQNQQNITGFRNGSMFDIALATTLPLTDRNQGNILKAQSHEQEMIKTYLADRADVRAQVEAGLADYADAIEHLTQFNTPATLKAAYDLKKNLDAAYRSGDRKLGEFLSAHHAYRERLARVVEFESTYWRTLNKLNAVVGLNAFDHQTGATQRVEYGEKK